MRRRFVLAAAIVAALAATFMTGPATAAPNLGPNVIVFDPSMSQASIQSTLDSISTQQVPSQFGSSRYAIFFEPGTYGSAASPLDFQVGYYTQVAGLGAQPGDCRDQRCDQRLQPVRRQRKLQWAKQLLAVAVESDAQRRTAELAAGVRAVLGRSIHSRLRQLRGDVGGLAGRTDASRDHERLGRAAGLLREQRLR